MINNKISLTERIYKPSDVYDYELKDVLDAIRKGNFMGQDLIGITQRVQAEPNHDNQNELKKWNLPVALFNGTFSYKNDCSIKDYSNFTAIDLDGFGSKEEMDNARNWLMQYDFIYAIFTTPSGHGLKAIVIHDNNNPECHKELYEQLKGIFDLPEKDPSVCDLSRGHYICYDPNLYVNRNCVPYHFVHNPIYAAKTRTIMSSAKNMPIQDINMLRWTLALKHPVGTKSDESIIAILNSCWKKKPERWMVGNRKNSVFNSATEFCHAGVNIDKAINYLVQEYTNVGLGEDEIVYQANRGYQLNAKNYGDRRRKYDGYGGNRHLQKKS